MVKTQSFHCHVLDSILASCVAQPERNTAGVQSRGLFVEGLCRRPLSSWQAQEHINHTDNQLQVSEHGINLVE